jgi:D-alanyl-D-alanine carboxypeptidase
MVPFVALAAASVKATAATPGPQHHAMSLAVALQSNLQRYLSERKSAEHISAASLALNFANGETIDVAAGTMAFDGGPKVTPKTLFQIGSNTKAFTSTLILKLQTAGKLKITDTLGHWLPQYGPWKNITIRQLLDMTSGLATYDNTQPWQKDYSANPVRFFSEKQLVAYVDPHTALKKGWNYSNTGYILASMIAEKADGSHDASYGEMVHRLVIQPAKIPDMYYYPGIYPRNLRLGTVHGYFNNTDPISAGLKPLLGKSVRDDSLSWAQAAGGIVATPHAIARWARDLYRGTILTAAERSDQQKLVSLKTGLPAKVASANDPRTFGLGVAQVYRQPVGLAWFYEGETLGYRLVHVYIPKQNLVIVLGLNSQTAEREDHIGDLVATIVGTLKQFGRF